MRGMSNWAHTPPGPRGRHPQYPEANKPLEPRIRHPLELRSRHPLEPRIRPSDPEAYTPPPVDRQTPVKTLAFRNYCCER